jgi:PAS domain S-box-containing protein
MSENFMIPPNLEAQAYLAAIISSSDDAIVSKDLNGNITSWNGGAEQVFGYSAEEAVGRHVSMLVPAHLLPEEDFILSEIREGKSIRHFDTKRRRKDGTLIDVSVTVSPIRNSNGDIIGVSKVARDVTELKQMDRLRANLSAIIESSDDAIISKDLNGYITSWNKSAERIFGYTAEEVVGKHITILIPSDRIKEEDNILTTLRTGARIDHFETVRRHKDGHFINVSLTVSPIKDSQGNIVGASKISRDITERIKVEGALKETTRKKDEFLANMSHELRTPMNAVIGLTSILQNMDDMPEKARKFIDTLKVSADNMMDLINDLLDFSKIEADAFELEQVEFNLAEQVEKAISVMNVKAREKGLKLYVHFSPIANRRYVGDPLRLHQVIINLLSNALKFTERGSIEVSIEGRPGADTKTMNLTIKVLDTGIGIAPDKIETIFERFTQADSSITRRYGGSGLGLSICQGIVEKMGGTIKAESKLGHGATFIVQIPLTISESTSTVESFSATIAPNVPITEKDVLLVEDYEPNILVTSALLERLNLNYHVARNGYEALKAFGHGNFDVILMDVQMHDLDGLEATRRIRKLENERGLDRTPIIAMTAHVREQDKALCIEAGMDDFLPKPFNPAELAQKIARFRTMRSQLNSIEADLASKDQK